MSNDHLPEAFDIRLYDTLTRVKREFEPIDPANVRMYVCGPTVYDFAHIGNARPAIVFDVLFRILRNRYGAAQVTYVRNVTDVDDKINARAGLDYPNLALNDAIAKVTAETERQYHEDVSALGCLPPTREPRATEHVPQMIEMIETLISNANAYEAEGHVLFDVKSWKREDGSSEYGRLSGRSLDEMIAGARVEVAPYKRDPMDFVLWKPSGTDEPGWNSPWGRGRPGWHIECSAMSAQLLGETFDIHGGGIDLVFPHHENEIAQSRCAQGTQAMANVWMHNGFLQVEGQKMAKSAGNFITIRDLLASNVFGGCQWPGQVLRGAMLMTHYRQPIDFSERLLRETNVALNGFKAAAVADNQARPSREFIDALADDMNTPRAMAEMHRLASAAKGQRGGAGAASELFAALNWLGIDIETYNPDWLQTQYRQGLSDDDHNEIDALVGARSAARAEKNWQEADRIRDKLETMGIQVLDRKDTKSGEIVTSWEMKS